MPRPPSGQPRKERIALTLTPEIMQEIREMASKEKCSISAIVERLLTDGLTSPQADNPHFGQEGSR